MWNQALADTDANNALHNWLKVCDPPVEPSISLDGCCLHIVMDTNTYFDFITNHSRKVPRLRRLAVGKTLAFLRVTIRRLVPILFVIFRSISLRLIFIKPQF